MPNYFSDTRNIELSLLYYLETNLNIDWPGTTVLKTFHQNLLSVQFIRHQGTSAPPFVIEVYHLC